jgi:hypothetical protein
VNIVPPFPVIAWAPDNDDDWMLHQSLLPAQLAELDALGRLPPVDAP